MEFDIESDPDTMFELFGEDYVCFAEYVPLSYHVHADCARMHADLCPEP